MRLLAQAQDSGSTAQTLIPDDDLLTSGSGSGFGDLTPFNVRVTRHEVGGYVCHKEGEGEPDATIADADSDQHAAIWLPDTSEHQTFPVIVFGHGYGGGGDKLGSSYSQPLEYAAAGYVVIANESAPNFKCHTMAKDMMRSVDWICDDNSPFVSIVNCDKVGVAGYSMGGLNTHLAASDVYGLDDFANNHIEAAVTLHSGRLNDYAGEEVQGEVQIPATKVHHLWTGGTADSYSRVSRQKDAFDKAPSNKDAMVAWGTGLKHTVPGEAGNPWTPQVIRWFNCHLKDAPADCDLLLDPETGVCATGSVQAGTDATNPVTTELAACASYRASDKAEVQSSYGKAVELDEDAFGDDITWCLGDDADKCATTDSGSGSGTAPSTPETPPTRPDDGQTPPGKPDDWTAPEKPDDWTPPEKPEGVTAPEKPEGWTPPDKPEGWTPPEKPEGWAPPEQGTWKPRDDWAPGEPPAQKL